MPQPAAAAACPDGGVYDRLGRLERDAAVDRHRWSTADENRRKLEGRLDDLSTAMTRLSTTINVATALLGFLIALAGVVVPLVRG